MTETLLLKARCQCHLWIIDAFSRLSRCRRCGEVPISEGLAGPDDVTLCLHDGPCLPEPTYTREAGHGNESWGSM